MSFMSRDQKETDFAHSASPNAINSKQDLEVSRDALLSLIAKCEADIAAYERDLNVVEFALHNKFYR